MDRHRYTLKIPITARIGIDSLNMIKGELKPKIIIDRSMQTEEGLWKKNLDLLTQSLTQGPDLTWQQWHPYPTHILLNINTLEDRE